MTRSRIARIIGAGLSAAILAAGWTAVAPASAGVSAANMTGLRFTISPNQAPPGTTVTATAADRCPPPPGAPNPQALVSYITSTGSDFVGTRVDTFQVAADGSWSGPIQPAGPAGVVAINAVCVPDGYKSSAYASYQGNTFTSVTTGHGYFLSSAGAGVAPYGDANICATSTPDLSAPIVGMAVRPNTGAGVWLVGSDGGVFSLGDARFHGSAAGGALRRPVVGMAATPDGDGYWLVGADGGVFTFGTARFFGSTGGANLNAPIVAIAATSDGQGYWLVGSDGGIFTFGDAGFFGSTGGQRLNGPVVGMAPNPNGGYWLATSDGGVFSFGAAPFHGSAGATKLNQPIVGITVDADGGGYWLAASDGGVFSYGSAQFYGAGPKVCSVPQGITNPPSPPQIQQPPFAAIAATPAPAASG